MGIPIGMGHFQTSQKLYFWNSIWISNWSIYTNILEYFVSTKRSYGIPLFGHVFVCFWLNHWKLPWEYPRMIIICPELAFLKPPWCNHLELWIIQFSDKPKYIQTKIHPLSKLVLAFGSYPLNENLLWFLVSNWITIQNIPNRSRYIDI